MFTQVKAEPHSANGTASLDSVPALEPSKTASVWGALLAMIPLIPLVVNVLAVGLYCCRAGGCTVLEGLPHALPEAFGLRALAATLGQFNPALQGMLLAVLMWIIAGCVVRRWAAADRANASAYGELCERVEALSIQLVELKEKASGATLAWREASEHCRAVRQKLSQAGIRWVMGTGYIDAWKRIHRAEEALIEIEPTPAVLRLVLYDVSRIDGSELTATPGLTTNLSYAAEVLDTSIVPYLPTPVPNPRTATTNGADAANATRGPDATGDGHAETAARTAVRHARSTIASYRDELAERLVRARNRIHATSAFVGLFTCLLLAFGTAIALQADAIAVPPGASSLTSVANPAAAATSATAADSSATSPRPPDRKWDPAADPIVAVTAYYLVGAIIGLFNRLRSDAGSDAAAEDYGLSTARLLLTPTLSGLAAVGGVLITALATEASGSAHNVPPGTHMFHSVLTLSVGQLPLLTAAAFGLVPGLLVDGLGVQAERYKKELKSSTPAGESLARL